MKRLAARLLEVLRALVPVIVFTERRGERLRESLERLRGIWPKFGQTLSMRYDLLPASICEALSPLQGQMKADERDSGSFGREVVESELGPIGKNFSEFRDDPVAAATVGQVYRGRLLNGNKVAIKILRPGIAAVYAIDLSLLALIATVVDWVVPRVYARDMVKELRAMVAEEVDLRFEASNMKHMRKVLKKHRLHVPRVYESLCTSQVIVMEWIDGVTIGDVLKRKDRERYIGSYGLTSKKICQRIQRSLMRQVFESNRYHGDMHPRNVMLCRRKIFLIDFGTTSETSAGFLALFHAYIRSITGADYERAADLYCLLAMWPKRGLLIRILRSLFRHPGHADLQRDLVRELVSWAARARVKTLSFSDRSMNALGVSMTDVIRRAGGAVSWAWLRLMRAFSTVEAMLIDLWPTMNPIKEMSLYLRSAAQRERLAPFSFVGLANAMNRWIDRVDEHSRLETASLRLECMLKGLR